MMRNMKVTYLGHAGFVVECAGTLLIMDPWLGRNGAFDRAWFQFPRNHHLLDELLTKIAGARHVGLYISHEHEDHFCRDTLETLSRHSPTVIIPRYRGKDFVDRFRMLGYLEIREIPDGEASRFFDLDVRIFIDEAGINRDSAILVTAADGRKFLNFNDCKIFDRCPQLHAQYAPFDVFACQYTGATMHPICYEYDSNTYRSVSRKKRQAKFFGVKTAIERLQPAVYVPSAGPAAFLDPQLFHLNFEADSVFPRSWEFKTYLEQHRCQARVLQLPPGGWLDVQSDIQQGGPRFDLDSERLHSYLIDYQAEFISAPASQNRSFDAEPLRHRLVEHLQRKLDVYAEFGAPLKMRSNIYFAFEELPDFLKVDFSECRVRIVDRIDEAAYYLHRTALKQLQKVIAGEMDWEAYFLTFRFRNRREPDEYDSGINLFLFAELEAYRFGLEQLIRFRDGSERITVTLAGCGTKYEINRLCPHQGGDLHYALLEGNTLICPRHYWRFDLANGGKCTANDDSIDAVRLDEFVED